MWRCPSWPYVHLGFTVGLQGCFSGWLLSVTGVSLNIDSWTVLEQFLPFLKVFDPLNYSVIPEPLFPSQAGSSPQKLNVNCPVRETSLGW